MLFLLLLLSFLGFCTQSSWEPVKRGVYTQFYIQDTPLRIKTNNTPGDLSLFDFVRLNQPGGSRDIIVEIKIVNTTHSHFSIFEGSCKWEFNRLQLGESTQTNMWAIYKAETRFVVTNEGERWEFRFNESLLVDCRNWGANYDLILFRSTDTATIAYQGLTVSLGDCREASTRLSQLYNMNKKRTRCQEDSVSAKRLVTVSLLH
ncbi:hypothetical protein ACHWQZ_G009172 [Mnemiopsis leidyi]